jgi:hypothetical protein
MRRHTDCLLIGRRWVGGRGAYSWVGILRLPRSINTSRLLRALPSRIWSFFYGGCKLWRLRQVPTTFTFFILRGFKASKGRQLQICKTTYVSRKNCSDSRPWSIFCWKLGWWAVRLIYAACFKRMARELFLQRDGAVPTFEGFWRKVDARNTVSHRGFNACRLRIRSVFTHCHPRLRHTFTLFANRFIMS